MIRRFAPICLAAALASALAPAQNQAPQTPDMVIRINVNLVQVDAVVTDGKGHPVTDLKPGDFEIRQDGKLQNITNFSYIDTTPGQTGVRGGPVHTAKKAANDPAAPPPVPLRTSQIRRTFAMVVDDLGLAATSLFYVRDALLRFVDQDMQPGDLAAVIRTSAGMGSLQQFTTDKRLLHRAIDQIRFTSFGRVGLDSFEPLGQGVRGTATVERASMMTAGSLSAIHGVVSGLRDLPGRKLLVLFTEDLRMVQQGASDARSMLAMNRLTDAADRSSVVISSIDPRGLQYYGPTAADRPGGMMAGANVASQRSADVFNSQDGMVRLADATGGLFLHNNNDIPGQLHRAVEDANGYYLIGYHPDASTFDRKTGEPSRFHHIQVRVKRAWLQVRSRKGFFGSQDAPRTIARTPQALLMRAATSPFTSSAIHLRMTGLFCRNQQIGSYVTALLYIDGNDIQFQDAPDSTHKAVLDMLSMTFNENGQMEDPRDQTHTITVTDEQYRKIRQDGFLFLLQHPVKKPGGYQVRVALRDVNSQRVGSASQYVEVPDTSKGQLTLTSILLQEASAAAAPDDTESVEGNVRSENPMTSAAVRSFPQGTAVAYSLRILNARADAAGVPQLEVEARVFRDGKQLLPSQPRALNVKAPVDFTHLGAGGQLTLGSTPPGDYVLQVIVTDQLAPQKSRVASQWMDFEVVDGNGARTAPLGAGR
jgi:VWFA-related protein